jgi:ferredoxin--NADP+ reductase
MDAIASQSPAATAVLTAATEKWTDERVLSLHHWTPNLLSFRTTRSRSFRFTAGHYARLGLGEGDDTVWRPYSMVSPTYADYLEFIAILVPGGAFSQHLAQLHVGDTLRVDKASFGFLTVDQLAPGKELWLLASGTGLGPFLSILGEPAVWQDFERIFLVHSVRHVAELAWREEMPQLGRGELFAEATATLRYLPVVTREPGAAALEQRIPQLLENGRLEQVAGCQIDEATSRAMVCGNPEMNRELRQVLSRRGLATGRRGIRGQMAFENYW